MAPVTSIEIDRVFFLVFLAAAGLASVLSHCLLRKYLVASLVASALASWFTGASVAGYIIFWHLPLAKLSWLGEVYAPAFVFAIPISLAVGLPFLLLRRWTSPPQKENGKRIWQVPNRARVGLSTLLCGLVLLGVVAVYQQMQREQIERTVYEASKNGTPADIQKALRVGGNVNSRLGYGTTPLMIAAFYGRTGNVAFLLKNGADPNVVCPRGETALKWALENKHEDVVTLLRRAGARK